MVKPVDIAGQTFGLLTAVKRVGSDKAGKAVWLFNCDCGNVKEVLAISVRRGLTFSCGCAHKRAAIENAAKASQLNYKHGGTGTPEYKAWVAMRARCGDESHVSYKDYGGRGIRVCDEWVDDYPAFLAHIGKRPKGDYSLDRIDNEKGYSPGNVRWADKKTQANNRRPRKKKEVTH